MSKSLEHAVGGEVVTLAGPPGTLFFPTGPGGVLTEGQVTVTTDPVSHFATVYVFSPRGVPGSQNITLTGALAGTPAAPSHTIAAQEWRGNLASSLDPTLPAPTPFSPPPPEGVVFTAHRHRKVGYSGRQEVFAQTEVTGSPSPVTTEWFKPGEEGPRPPYSDDGFNGDADLLGDNSDPGDPRDSISWGSGAAVPASEGDPLAYPVSSGGEVPTRVVGPYGAPGPMMGTYTATDAYSPPGKATSTGGSFEAAQAVSTLESIGYSQWGADSGWQGNGELGVKAYTVSSTFTEGTGVAQEVVYEGSGGQMESSTTTYATQSATMEQMEVRLQSNKDVEAGKPVSQVFLLTKSIVEGETTTSEFVAALRLTINSGKTSDACEITAGALPPDVTTQGGVVSMRSPVPALDKLLAYRLIPVDLAVRKKGTSVAPDDGLLVKKGDILEFALAPNWFGQAKQVEDIVTWHYRQLKPDGSFTEWTAYGAHGKGTTFEHIAATAGIFEIKTSASGSDHFYKRKRDDTHSDHKKEENNCVGIVDEDWQINVRQQALINLGSTAYAFAAANPPLPKGSWKCNLFVAHKATDGGAAVPLINGNFTKSYPPVANQWAGVEVKAIPAWTLLGRSAMPQPGFIVARGVAGGTGHTGILDYDGCWISAGATEVNRKSDLRNARYQPARVRKYK